MEQRRTLSGALKRKLKKEKETRETAALQNVPRISQFFKNNIQSTVEAQEPVATGDEEQRASKNINVPLRHFHSWQLRVTLPIHWTLMISWRISHGTEPGKNAFHRRNALPSINVRIELL